jgi:hypothetical protein
VITTPLNFAFWGKLYLNFAGNHGIAALPELEIPLGEIFQSIFIIMGIPLVLGMLCGQYLPKVANILKKPLQYLSIAVFIAMVIIIFTGNLDVFMKCIRYIFLIVLLHNLLALGIGFGTSTLLKLPYKDRRTLTIETGIQNSGLGLILLLNPNIFPGQTADLKIIEPTETEPKCVIAEISQYNSNWDVLWFEDDTLAGNATLVTDQRAETSKDKMFECTVSDDALVGRIEVVDKKNNKKIVKTIDLINPQNKQVTVNDKCGQWARNGGMVVITAWWGVWHIISGFTLAYLWRKRGRKEPNEE